MLDIYNWPAEIQNKQLNVLSLPLWSLNNSERRALCFECRWRRWLSPSPVAQGKPNKKRAQRRNKKSPEEKLTLSVNHHSSPTSLSEICLSRHGRQMQLSRPYVYDFLLRTVMDEWCLSICPCCLALEPCEKKTPSPSYFSLCPGSNWRDQHGSPHCIRNEL